MRLISVLRFGEGLPVHRAWILLVAGVLLAAGATPSAGRSAEPPLPSALQAVTDRVYAAHPEIPGLDISVISPRNAIAWSGVAGREAFGGALLTGPRPYRIASATKPFVAATALALVEQGKLALAASISGMISAETAAQLRAGGHDPDAILLRNLLEHTAGLPDHAQMQAYVDRILKDPQHRWTRAEQVALAMQGTRPLAPVGEAYAYSDTGYVIVGEIVERASGLPLAAAVRRHAGLDRLRLKSTWWEIAEPVPTAAKPRVRQYLGTVDTTDWHASFDLFGGGGIVSTTPELAAWYRAALMGKFFGRPETMAAALATPHVRTIGPSLAHAVLLPVTKFGAHMCWGHGGFWGTIAIYCPDIDLAVAVTVNANTSGRNSAIRDVLDGVARELDAAGIR